MISTTRSTLLHTLELVVVVIVAISVLKLMNIGSEASLALTTVVLGALAKYARANDVIPVKDYVNKE